MNNKSLQNFPHHKNLFFIPINYFWYIQFQVLVIRLNKGIKEKGIILCGLCTDADVYRALENLQMTSASVYLLFWCSLFLSLTLSLSFHIVSQCEFESLSELPMCVYIAEAARRWARARAAFSPPHRSEAERAGACGVWTQAKSRESAREWTKERKRERLKVFNFMSPASMNFPPASR